jgi:hypothetical protein
MEEDSKRAREKGEEEDVGRGASGRSVSVMTVADDAR